MEPILEAADAIQREAWSVIEDTDIINIWSGLGATINLVGSLKTGLLIHNPDIDFHIYTDPFDLADSFLAISRLAENRRIKKITYANLLAAEDRCIEWHAFYEGENGRTWQIDMIHILNDSPYAGYFETVAQRISDVLTPETRGAILSIKAGLPGDEKVMSILIYQAVIEGGVRSVGEFRRWMAEHPNDGIVTWMP